ncbi:hypothetical protein [Pseudomonas corrugata]|uniref:hypothetical protein n=1 Tax=Pseudomonas corrugata TaxID=47879 RepID=UPI0004BB5EB6|nr:hypothetical protein [Pseudomonas corrugata]
MPNFLRRFWGHVVLFGISKSSVLFAPFLAAGLLSNNQYGALEWWLSLSMTLGPLMTLGAHGVVAYGALGGIFAPYIKAAVIYVVSVCSFALFLVLLLPVLGFDWKAYFFGVVLLQSTMIVLQLALSAHLKGVGKGAWASVAESTLYIALLLSLLLTVVGVDFVFGFMLVMVVLEIFMLWLLIKLSALSGINDWFYQDYKKLFSFSHKFLISGTLMGAFMAGPRLLMGVFADPAVVGSFSIAFRWLSIAIVIHQFVNTFFFRRIYGVDSTKRKFAILGCVGLVAFFSVAIALTLSSRSIRMIRVPLPEPNDIWLVWSMGGVMVLWSTSACLEGVLNSAGRVMSQTVAVTLGLVVFLMIFSCFYFLGEDNTKVSLTIAWVAGFIGMIIAQLMFLFRSKFA